MTLLIALTLIINGACFVETPCTETLPVIAETTAAIWVVPKELCVVGKWFMITAVDTSGNESEPVKLEITDENVKQCLGEKEEPGPCYDCHVGNVDG